MKELLYPHFLKCVDFVDDIYWKNIFENLAFGIPPYNTFIRKKYLISNVKGREFNYKIEEHLEANYVFESLYTILHNKLGLLSDIQIKEEELNFENSSKKKLLKNSIIEEYCIRMGQKYNLSTTDIKKLFNYIQLSLTIRNIIPSDIKYDDGFIISIKGITFRKNKMSLKKIVSGSYVSTDVVTDYDYMNNQWDKYISLLIR